MKEAGFLLLFIVLFHAVVVESGHFCVTYLYACSAVEQEIKQKSMWHGNRQLSVWFV